MYVGTTAHVPFDLIQLINPDKRCGMAMAAPVPMALGWLKVIVVTSINPFCEHLLESQLMQAKIIVPM